MRVGVLVPVKAFPLAKQRLTSALAAGDRMRLARWCAERVVAAAGDLPVHVVCDDQSVAEWATSLGAHVVWCPGVGLNPAVERGMAALRDAGFDQTVVAHGDLPLARSLEHVPFPETATFVPDHRYDGTNVLALPTVMAGRFHFQYGRGSFRRHVYEALRLGLPVRVLRDEDLAHDLDTPTDLDEPRMEDVRAWLRTNRANHR